MTVQRGYFCFEELDDFRLPIISSYKKGFNTRAPGPPLRPIMIRFCTGPVCSIGLWSINVPEHVTTRKTQRRIHAGGRRSGRRSSHGLCPSRSYNAGREGLGWMDG